MARTLIRGNTQIMDATISNGQIAADAAIELSKIVDGTQLIKADGTVAFTQNVDLGGNKITNAGAGTDPGDLVTKGQLDAVSAGLDAKESVRAATTAEIDLTTGGELDIDGVTDLVAGDRVLVKNQTTNPEENGIYVVALGSWTRATDFDGSPTNEVQGGSYVFVTEGTANGQTGWIVVANGDIAVGTDPIVWTQFNAVAEYTGGDGITVSGSTISADVDGTTIIANGGTGAQLEVADNGIDETKIVSTALGVGLTGGSGQTIKINFAAWTKYAKPTEPVATGTTSYTFNGGNAITANTFDLYLNGVLLEPHTPAQTDNDYAINYSTGVVTFANAGDAPKNGDKLFAHFVDVP